MADPEKHMQGSASFNLSISRSEAGLSVRVGNAHLGGLGGKQVALFQVFFT